MGRRAETRFGGLTGFRYHWNVPMLSTTILFAMFVHKPNLRSKPPTSSTAPSAPSPSASCPPPPNSIPSLPTQPLGPGPLGPLWAPGAPWAHGADGAHGVREAHGAIWAPGAQWAPLGPMGQWDPMVPHGPFLVTLCDTFRKYIVKAFPIPRKFQPLSFFFTWMPGQSSQLSTT